MAYNYARRNQLAIQRGFRNEREQRAASKWMRTDPGHTTTPQEVALKHWSGHAWQAFQSGTFRFGRNKELDSIIADFWNVIVLGRGNSDAARAVIDQMEAWADRNDRDYREGYLAWREFYKEGR